MAAAALVKAAKDELPADYQPQKGYLHAGVVVPGAEAYETNFQLEKDGLSYRKRGDYAVLTALLTDRALDPPPTSSGLTGSLDKVK